MVDQSEAADADKNKKITYEDLLTNAPIGSAAAPSFAFTTDSDTGLFQTSNGQIGFAVDGGEIGAVTTSGSEDLALERQRLNFICLAVA